MRRWCPHSLVTTLSLWVKSVRERPLAALRQVKVLVLGSRRSKAGRGEGTGQRKVPDEP